MNCTAWFYGAFLYTDYYTIKYYLSIICILLVALYTLNSISINYNMHACIVTWPWATLDTPTIIHVSHFHHMVVGVAPE